MITFDREVHYAWGRRLTWARAMFFLNRYLSLLQYFATFASTILPPSYFQACIIILFAVWAVFSGLRVYAISGNRKLLAYIVVFFALIPVATCIALDTLVRLEVLADVPFVMPFCIQDGSNVNQFTSTICADPSSLTTVVRATLHYPRNASTDSAFPVGVATRVPLLLSEAIVIVVTLLQTRSAYLEHPEHQGYASLVMREGVLYFLTMVLRRIFQPLIAMRPSIPPIVVSRFYFQLDELRKPLTPFNVNVADSARTELQPLPPTPGMSNDGGDAKVRYLHEVLVYTENAYAHA
ncbi:hypothetical protein K466DRAFT_573300 [Polyporus arcularius HHB13444]|uniref:DUF6533 domain-containing protein n=1 Tax=Polyporus arcularius HHB13444 TaxID=1314778 RepID=A0A5C3PRK8_9APHY|nr:hypothetical protein K466DRAFT_573300 [Polyporus arcularius HHB13444]